MRCHYMTTYGYFESFLSLKEFNYPAYSIFEDDSSWTSVYNAEIVAKGNLEFQGLT
jgi:hypothetical protein